MAPFGPAILGNADRHMNNNSNRFSKPFYVALGFVIGAATTLVVYSFVDLNRDMKARMYPFTVVRASNDQLSSLFPDEALFAIRYQSKEFASIAIDKYGVSMMQVFNDGPRTVISVNARDAKFPGELSVTNYDMSHSPAMPSISVYDSDLDGIPDVKLDRGIKYRLNSVEWAPTTKLQASPTTTQDTSTNDPSHDGH